MGRKGGETGGHHLISLRILSARELNGIFLIYYLLAQDLALRRNSRPLGGYLRLIGALAPGCSRPQDIGS